MSWSFFHVLRTCTSQKIKFSIKDFFSKCDQMWSLLWIWSHLLNKSWMENFIFCAAMKTLVVLIYLAWLLKFSHFYYMIQRDNNYQDMVSLQSWNLNQTPKIQHFYQYVIAAYLWETRTLVNQYYTSLYIDKYSTKNMWPSTVWIISCSSSTARRFNVFNCL